MIPESVDDLFSREMVLTGNSVAGRQPTICEEGCLNAHGQAGASVDHYGMLVQTWNSVYRWAVSWPRVVP